MKSDLDVAVGASKSLESTLERNFGATGRGLHEKISSVSARLDPQTVRDLRWVATIRNKIVHEEETSGINNRSRFESIVDRLMVTLSSPDKTPAAVASTKKSYFERFKKRRPLVAILCAGACASVALWLQWPLLDGVLLSVGGFLIGYILGAYIAGLAALTYLVICLVGAAAVALLVLYWAYETFVGK